MDLKGIYTESILSALNGELDAQTVYSLIETPKHQHLGDLAFPCFSLAKTMKKSPLEIAEALAPKINGREIDHVEPAGPYINVFFSKNEIAATIIPSILAAGNSFGSGVYGIGKTVVLDMSSPNIAKPFSMGHLRSTVIGNSLALIAEKIGYKAVRLNHLGDWGTQFGKLITAYRKWGVEEDVQENPIEELFKLYIRFHQEAENDPILEEEGRKAFKELEDGDEENIRIWTWFRDESLKAFMTIYDLMNVQFDDWNGEAFYNDKMGEVIALLEEQKLLETSEGAEVVRLDDKQLPPCLIKKSDGATLYATRDLASALYRQREYHFDEALYIVGQEQTIHFKQVFGVLKKMGYSWADQMKHVPFGLYLKDGKKMSTRKGRVILLEEVLNEAISLAANNIKAKNPGLQHADEVAKAVGTGAVLFHDLKNDRMNNIEFSLEDMLAFEGETGPYIQYTHARANTLLKKSPIEDVEFKGLSDDDSWEIVKLLRLFPEVVSKAYTHLSPSIIAKYLIDTAKSFNKYYGKVRILEQDEELSSRLALVQAVVIVLAEGLRLLGISAPDQM
ncbi:arginine--tRNA ligase [Falsibacillus pallidus]|uniref:arginine--tRNA ligase n=1 Tax=Falsibacillus pallidus TaxID=493781 RepID=UPI003D97D58C